MTDREFENRKPGQRIKYFGGDFDMDIICLDTGLQQITRTGPNHLINRKVGSIVDLMQIERMAWIEDIPNTFIAKNGKEITCEVKHVI